MRSALPALLLAFAAPLAAVDPGLMDLAGPETNFVLGVRVAAISDSPLVKGMLTEAAEGEAGLGGLLEAMGENPLEGLEEVLLLGHLDPGQSNEEMDGLLLARGNFAGDRVQKAFCSEGCTEESYSGERLFHGKHEGEEATFVKLSERYAAAGKAARVKALLQRRAVGAKPQLASELNDWVRGLDKHHLWLAAKGPFEAPSSEGGGPPVGQMVEKLTGLGLGITLGDDVEIGLQVEAESDEAAVELHTMTQGLLMLFSMGGEQQGAKPNDAAALLKNLQLRREGGRVFADLRIPADQLEKTVRAGIADAAEGAEAAPETATGVGGVRPAKPQTGPLTPAKPRSKGPIRIYGLGDEPVVVESQKPQ